MTVPTSISFKIRVLLLVLASIVLVAASTGMLANQSQLTGPQAQVEQMLAGERPPDLPLLQQIGPESLPPLLKALSTGHPVLERAYSVVVSPLPDAASRRLPQLLGAQIRRLHAAAWVGHLGPAAKPAVPQLIELLKDDIADANASHSLALLGPEARDAVPALLVALRQQRPFAAIALASIGTPETVGAALDAVSHSGPAWQQAEAKAALRKLRARFPALTTVRALERNH